MVFYWAYNRQKAIYSPYTPNLLVDKKLKKAIERELKRPACSTMYTIFKRFLNDAYIFGNLDT